MKAFEEYLMQMGPDLFLCGFLLINISFQERVPTSGCSGIPGHLGVLEDSNLRNYRDRKMAEIFSIF